MSAILYPTPKILFLEDVFLNSYKEEQSERKDDWREKAYTFTRQNEHYEEPIEEQSEELSEEEPTEQIPILFKGLDEYPKKTKLKCWNCCRSIKGRPWFEPQTCNINFKNPKDVTMQIKGFFCSCHCVKRYTLTHTKNPIEVANKNKMLLTLYSVFNDRTTKEILPAPPHTERRTFGGPLSDEEYEKMIRELDEHFKLMADQAHGQISELSRMPRNWI